MLTDRLVVRASIEELRAHSRAGEALWGRAGFSGVYWAVSPRNMHHGRLADAARFVEAAGYPSLADISAGMVLSLTVVLPAPVIPVTQHVRRPRPLIRASRVCQQFPPFPAAPRASRQQRRPDRTMAAEVSAVLARLDVLRDELRFTRGQNARGPLLAEQARLRDTLAEMDALAEVRAWERAHGLPA